VASILLEERLSMKTNNQILVGRQILDVVTSAMYNNPLMIYREYIQNAVDSIDQVLASGCQGTYSSQVKISIEGRTRAVVIEDNGVGVPAESAGKVLMSLGLSSKENGEFRGFRGIGRLGGIAYCDRLFFETRALAEDIITEVVWDRLELDRLSENGEQISLEDAMRAVATLSQRAACNEDPENFFRVKMENVHCFHSDQVMSVGAVRDYLAQVAPVPFADSFTQGNDVDKFLSSVPGFRAYEIWVNGKKIFRPYKDTIDFSENRSDLIEKIQKFEIYGVGNETIAKGWFANLQYLGSLPMNDSMRGIRVRQGNIEIGGEYFLADCFAERRFATWQVGEIHVYASALKANARRDGFEETPNYERFLEFITRLGSHLSKECRKASKNRNNYAMVLNSLNRVRNGLQDSSLYIDEEHHFGARLIYLEELSATKNYIEKYNLSKDLLSDATELERKINQSEGKANYLVEMINGQKFSNKSGKQAFVDFVKNCVKNKGNNNAVDKVLLESLSDYFKQSLGCEKINGFTINSDGI